ncbi:MAG: YcxB family protein [Oscillospiraceae bacterium]
MEKEENIINNSENVTNSEQNSEEFNANVENSVETVEKNKENTPLLSFEYNITNEEEGEAFTVFQKKFVYKKNWIKSILFGIVAVLFIISSVRDPSQALNYILAALCMAMIFIIWYNTKKIKSSLLDALKLVENDKYIFTLYKYKFKIETIIPPEERENSEEEIPDVEPKIYDFSDLSLKAFEDTDKFLLIFKKQTIYVLPKRCMTQKQIDTVRDTLKARLDKDFEILEKK